MPEQEISTRVSAPQLGQGTPVPFWPLGGGLLQTYTQVSIQKLKSIHSATHPGAQLGRTSLAVAEGVADEASAEDLLDQLEAEDDEDLDDVGDRAEA